MNKIKEMIIRKKLKYEIENKEKGLDIIKFDKGIKIKEDQTKYFYLLNDISSIVKGIKNADVKIDKNEIHITYDENYISKEKIKMIIDELKEFIIENMDELEKIEEDDIENIVKVMKIKFKERILMI